MKEMITQNVEVFDKTAKMTSLQFYPLEVSEWQEVEDGMECILASSEFANVVFLLSLFKPDIENIGEYKLALSMQDTDYEDKTDKHFSYGSRFACIDVTEQGVSSAAKKPIRLLKNLFAENVFGEMVLFTANDLLSCLPCEFEHMTDDATDALLHSEEPNYGTIAKLTTPFGFIECSYETESDDEDYGDGGMMVLASIEHDGFATEDFLDAVEEPIKELISAHQWGMVYETLQKAFIENFNAEFSVRKDDCRFGKAMLADEEGYPIAMKKNPVNGNQYNQHNRKATKKKYKPKKKSKKRHK